MKKNFFSLLRPASAILLWIAVWYIAAQAVNPHLLIRIPLPHRTLAVFLSDCGSSAFWRAVLISLLHILGGFSGGALFGSLIGVLSSRFAIFRSLAAPLLHLIRSVPVAAFIILAWLWIPNAVLPSFIAFLMVTPVLCQSVRNGYTAADENLIEMAAVMGMRRQSIFFRIRLPLLAPFLREGCITGLGFAWKSGIAAEVICNPTGSIGSLLSAAKSSIDYEQVFAVTLTIVLLSFLLENLLKFLWKEQQR